MFAAIIGPRGQPRLIKGQVLSFLFRKYNSNESNWKVKFRGRRLTISFRSTNLSFTSQSFREFHSNFSLKISIFPLFLRFPRIVRGGGSLIKRNITKHFANIATDNREEFHFEYPILVPRSRKLHPLSRPTRNKITRGRGGGEEGLCDSFNSAKNQICKLHGNAIRIDMFLN